MEYPEKEKWPLLLDNAAAILVHYQTKEGVALRLGGGTALTFYMDHRHSFDLDFFVGHSAPHGGHLQRLMNSGLPAALSNDVRFPGNFIKLVWPEVGEIDLLTAPPLTPHEGTGITVNGLDLVLEHPEEIIAKKLVYRSSAALGRDLYDIYACITEGLIQLPNVKSLVGREKFDALLESVDYDGDRIVEEISQLESRVHDCTLGDIRNSVQRIMEAMPLPDFEVYEAPLNYSHLESRLGLEISTASRKPR